MSTTIDERVVEMRFDNEDFESNVKTSISTLNKLEQSLDLSGASKGLESVGMAAGRIDLSGLGSAVESVHAKFSALEVIAITALANITNSAVNAGKRLISSLSVDQISAGWSKFGDKTTSVATLVAQGYAIETVTEQLDRLNWYTDETSYSFIDMVSNIAKFTATGKGLEESVTAMEGIANWAALSGQNATTASRAMYQLSQAMGAGVMRKEDYKSIQNASMDTDEFRQKCLDAGVALGTLRKNANGTYTSLVSLSKNGAAAFSKSQFADKLTEGAWLTSDVMMKVFNDYSSAVDQIYEYSEEKGITASQAIEELGDKVDAFGLKAFKAAQEARTWSDVVSSVKDAVSTGWMNTFEIIFGNQEEATKFWTDLANAMYDVFAAGAWDRNEMLQGWKDLGGRDDLLESFWNTWEGIGSVLGTIKDAFREIFPSTTSEQLFSITERLKNLTEKFKMGEETAKNLKNTFKGLFAAIDLLRQAFAPLLGLIKPIAGALLYMADSILKVTGPLGEYIVSINNSAKKTQIFQEIFDKFVSRVVNIGKGVKSVIDDIVKAFEALIEMDTSGLETFGEKIKMRFEPLTKLMGFVGKAFVKIGDILKETAPFFLEFATAVGKAFGALGRYIADAFNNADYKKIFDIVNGTIFTNILLWVRDFAKTLVKLEKFNGIQSILENVSLSLQGMQAQLKANVLLKIAAAIAILAAALTALAMIDSNKLGSALAAVSVLFVDLFGAMTVFETLTSDKGFKSIEKVSRSMIKISAAVLILSIAMKNIAELDWNGVLKGIIGVAGLSSTLVVSAKELSESSGKLVKGATGLIVFAGAIVVLTEAVKRLGSLDATTLIKGLIGVGVLMAELAMFMRKTDLNEMGITKGTGILIFAAAMNVFAKAVASFGALDTNTIVKGLISIGAVLTGLGVFINKTGDANKVISTAIGLTILGSAMLIFSKAISNMGDMSWDQIGRGLFTMAGALLTLVMALKGIPNNVLSSSIGLVAIASALVILSNALTNMGGMTWEQIAASLTVLAGSLFIISKAINSMTTALPGAAALLIISTALALFVPVLRSLGSMPINEILLGLGALVGVFAVLGGAAYILAPLTPVLLSLAGAVVLFGVGCAAVGAGILAFSAGLSALAVSGVAGAAALVTIVTTLIGLIPMMLTQLANGVISFAQVIANGAVVIAGAIGAVLVAIMNVIILAVPKLVETVGVLLDAMLTALITYIPKLVTAGIQLLIGILTGISDNIYQITTVAVSIITNFINAIAAQLPQIIQAGMNVIVNFIIGLADAISSNTPRVVVAIKKLFSSLIQAGKDIIGSSISGFVSAGKNIVDGLINGIKSKVGSLVDAAKGVVKSALEGAKKLLGINSPSKEFEKVGIWSDEGLIAGFKAYSSKVTDAAKDVGQGALDGMSAAISHASDIINNGLDVDPTICPTIDLSNVRTGVKSLNAMFSRQQAMDISATMSHAKTNGVNGQNGVGIASCGTFNFTQINNSPKALDRIEIYRHTKNQISSMKELVNAI